MSHSRSILKGALKKNWRLYGLGVLSLLATSLTEVMAPKFSQWCIDLVSSSEGQTRVPRVFLASSPRQTLDHLMLGLVGMLFIAVIGRWGWRQSMARRTHDAGLELKLKLWERLRFQPLSIFQRHTLGDIMSRATADWNASRNIFGFTMVLTYDLIFFTSLSVGLMFSIDPVIASITLVVWPLLPPFILRLARLEKQYHLSAQEELATLSDQISQSVSSIRLQKATATEAAWLSQLGRSSAEYSRRRVEVLRTGWKIFPLSSIPTLFAYGILFIFGLHRLQSGVITGGEFVALCSYVLLLQGPLFELGNHIAEWQKGLASLDRMAEIFNLRSDYRTSHLPASESLDAKLLTVKNLSFSHQVSATESLTLTLRNVNLTIDRGDIVGITGPIGSGKSTLAQLICGMIEPPAGTVALFGKDVTAIPHASWVSHMSMVPQRAFLFAGSIRHNLCLDLGFTDSELWAILDLVQLKSDIEQMPKGLDSPIGEWGISLSGGQKQRLALARALLRPRDLFLFDDCLSAVDAHTEDRILESLKGYLKNRSCLWVAHRSSTLKICTAVYEMNQGSLRRLESPEAADQILEDSVQKKPRPKQSEVAVWE